MKISVYNGKSTYPKNKEEKMRISKRVSLPEAFNTSHISTVDEIIEIITENHWSPMIFATGTRSIENFLSTDFLVVDIDDGMTIDQAIKICSKMNVVAVIAPSTSHTPEHHKFRVVLPLSRTITNMEDYVVSWAKLAEYFPSIDPICKDNARYYIRCREDEITVIEGSKLLDPVEAPKAVKPKEQNRGKLSTIKADVTKDMESIVEHIYGAKKEQIPECIAHFIENAHTGLPGMWWSSLNNFTYVLTLQGIDPDTIREIVEELAPEPLDKKDDMCLKYAIRDGQRDRVEENEI